VNYVVGYVKIKSNWFDIVGRGSKNVYEKIGKYEGLNLYFQLYKFKLFNQEYADMFITSISLLRKETGYSSMRIFGLLKSMKSAKVIKVSNVSRWEYLLDENGNVKDKEVLIICACDLPCTERKEKLDVNGNVVLDGDGHAIIIDKPITKDDYFIPVSLGMIDKYKSVDMYGTSNGKKVDKYVAMYCLIMKWSNNLESKVNMRIEKIADILGIDKDYLHKMVYSMNRYYFMLSTRRVRKVAKGYMFEHFICKSDVKYNTFVEVNKDKCDKLVSRYDRGKVKLG